MSCQNEISYFTGEMPNYTERLVRCGTTDPHGNRAICEECENDPVKLRDHQNHIYNQKCDNEWLRSANWGEC